VTEQYSFRKGISTEDAAFIITDSVSKSINHTIHVGGILYDLAKAFDGINHEILLAKLHFYEIRGVSEDWIQSHLTNRRQKVEVKSPNTAQNFFCDCIQRNMEFPKHQF
jgi:hypothetical protein